MDTTIETTMTEHVLPRKGCSIHYWTGGPQDAPLVVFTHGACVDHHSFDSQIPVVAERYRVLAWDVRGHGVSQPMGERFSLPVAVEDLNALLDEVGVEKAMLVGHSNGTYISQELAFRHPERAKAMIIADGTCITWKHSAFEYWLLNVSGDMMNLLPFETLKKAGLSAFSANKAVQDYVYRAFSVFTKEDFIGVWKGLTRGLHYEPDYHITQPLLLTHGDGDATGDIRKIAPLWAAREPNCEYVVIPNARHMAIMDNPEFFTKILMDFIAKHSA